MTFTGLHKILLLAMLAGYMNEIPCYRSLQRPIANVVLLGLYLLIV